jgi:hypothetical protein
MGDIRIVLKDIRFIPAVREQSNNELDSDPRAPDNRLAGKHVW